MMLMITRYHTGLRTQQNMNTFLTSFEYMIYHKVVNKYQSNFVLCIDCFIAERVSLASYYCKEVLGFFLVCM